MHFSMVELGFLKNTKYVFFPLYLLLNLHVFRVIKIFPPYILIAYVFACLFFYFILFFYFKMLQLYE